MKLPIEILVVDDHPIVRSGLIQIMAKSPDIVVVAEASSGEEALAILETVSPDVIVTDFKMGGMTGLELVGRLKPGAPLPVVVLTMYEDESIFNAAADAGVTVFLLKGEVVDNIEEGIRAASEGKHYVSPVLGKYAMLRRERATKPLEKQERLESLTPAERKVLKLIADDSSTKQIADELSLSPHTVNSHRQSICRKLEVSGRIKLLDFALSNRSAIYELP